ncbi:MAG: hypothetical protein JST11_04345 [Acidobacteria bacterium]|nr:hypothetical protein [Acidobacteriota bacterium]
MLRRLVRRLLREEQGQDLVEYTLLIAMVSMVAFGLMYTTGSTAASAWTGAGNKLQTASTVASGGSATSTGGGGGHHDEH